MRLFVAGQSQRDRQLKKILEQNGHRVENEPPWDAAVLSLPRSEMPKNILFPRGQKIVCGITDAAFRAMAKENGWQLHPVLEDPDYTWENAILTAEGAMVFAAGRLDRALCACRFLVIGYGRIGKSLTRILRGIGCRVTVAARRKESREEAGPDSVRPEDIGSILPDVDVIFNTVPAAILNEDALKEAKQDVLLVELASAPYGIDRQAAEKLGLCYSLESGVPGRYCPLSAAETLYRFMKREGLIHE